MKKIISLGSIFCFAILSVSCSVKDESGNTVWTKYEISADRIEVKTALDGHSVVWEEGDMVSCFSHDKMADRYSLSFDITPKSIDGNTAVFEVTNHSGFTPKILIYPSSSNYRISAESKLTLAVPDIMEGKTGNAPSEGLVSLGIIEEGQVQMRNVMALLKFSIDSDDINRIVVTAPGGEPLSGSVVIDLESLQAIEGGNNYVSIIPEEETAAFASGTYYVPIPANEYSKGLSFRFERTNGEAAKKSGTSSYTASRNRFVNMGQESDWGLVFKPSIITKDIEFITSNGAVFPFSDKADASEAITAPKSGDINSFAGQGEIGPYYLVGWADMPFYFQVHNTSGEKSYFVSQNDYGMRLGGTIGDYIAFPAIEGFRLTSIYIEEGTKTSYYAITTVPKDDKSEPVYLTEKSVKITKNKTLTFDFDASKTEVGKSYRLVTGTTDPTSIKKISLTYINEE